VPDRIIMTPPTAEPAMTRPARMKVHGDGPDARRGFRAAEATLLDGRGTGAGIAGDGTVAPNSELGGGAISVSAGSSNPGAGAPGR
jgi:hypothetical protein